MYVTDLRGLRIFSLVSALKMGTVEDALLDPSCRYVTALCVRAYGPGARRLVARDSIKRVGRNAIILSGTDEHPSETALDDADRYVSLRTLIGLEVVSDYGNLVGHVYNAVLDPDTLTVEEYVIERTAFGRLLGRQGLRRIGAEANLSASKDVLIIPESILLEPPDTATAEPVHERGGRWLPPDMLDGQDHAGAAMG